MSVPLLGDEVLVRRTARAIALRAAALVAAAMLLLVALVTVVVVRGQDRAADRLLRTAATAADDVGDPPAGAWLLLAERGRLAASPGLPGELGSALSRLRARAGGAVRLTDVEVARVHYRVATQAREGRVVQVVLDLTTARDDRARLLAAMGVAAVLSLLLAGGLGALLARRAVRPLADALALQRTFVADASHELRTPLTLLSTRAQLLERSVRAASVAEQVRDDAAGVVRDVQRMGEVLEDLLVAADPRGEEVREPVEMGALVEAALDSARAHAEEAGVALVGSAGGGPLVVAGSAAALRRAVLALVDNAVDHSPAGGEVRVVTRREGPEVLVAVQDSGPGVPPGAVPDLLRRFHSGGHRAGRAHYGLGLALSNDVANRHGGRLRLADSATGATFELVLPAVR